MQETDLDLNRLKFTVCTHVTTCYIPVHQSTVIHCVRTGYRIVKMLYSFTIMKRGDNVRAKGPGRPLLAVAGQSSVTLPSYYSVITSTFEGFDKEEAPAKERSSFFT